MSTSTNAVIFFGYCWDEERALHIDLCEAAGIDWDEDQPDWVKIIAARRGLTDPRSEFEIPDGDDLEAKEQAYEAQRQANRDRIAEYDAALDAIRAEYLVELDAHCSGSCPMPMLSAWSLTAPRGLPVDVELPEVEAKWVEALDRWILEFEVEPPQDRPRFWLVSYWSD